MSIYGPAFFTDDELVAEIKAYVKARRDVSTGGVAVIASEGRRLEFTNTRDQVKQLDADIREMQYEARQRGLAIGGLPNNAIAVETGL